MPNGTASEDAGSSKIGSTDTGLSALWGWLEEQIALVGILDYRIMRAVAAYHAVSSSSSPLHDSQVEPSGLTKTELKGNEPQVRWNRVIAAYLDGQIDTNGQNQGDRYGISSQLTS